MNWEQFQRIQSRRAFLQECAAGVGTIALAHMLQSEGSAGVKGPLESKPPHFKPRAKNVIFLFMGGAPSQIDLFDPKPVLQKYQGQPLPSSLTKDLRLAFTKPTAGVIASFWEFKKHGQCGMDVSSLLPHIAACADQLCLVRSMASDAFNHHPGQLQLFTGHTLAGRPSMGSWVAYGLGNESQNLPGFLVLTSGPTGTSAGSDNFASGFLPSDYAGTVFRSSGDPILYMSNPEGISKATQALRLEAMRDLNRHRFEQIGDLEIASRINAYELAFRMQAEAPELVDFSKESRATLEMYGLDGEVTRTFGTNCLLARRMVERGVRFVLLIDAGWDHHTFIKRDLPKSCAAIDKPAAALVRDLAQRGLLDETLVVWSGEFGRTPIAELRKAGDFENAGRDHHPEGFSMWLAGGGTQPGLILGETDELGLKIVRDRVHVHDLQATILHCLGLDHRRLTYRYMGRDFRLTDVHGEVVTKMLL